MTRPDYHIFICGQNRPPRHPRSSCGEKGCTKVIEIFSQELIKRNLQNVALNQTNCLGPCQTGPNVLVYPGGTLYGAVKPEDVSKIIDQHIIGGEIYTDKILPADIW